MADEETTLEYTPTWVVAAVCTVIVAISLAAERLLHYAGKYLKKKNQKPLYEALQKVKEGRIVKICVHEDVMRHLLPCSFPPPEASNEGESSAAKPETTSHLRCLLAETGEGYCEGKHQVPLLSLEALHHLHIFIFVLAIGMLPFQFSPLSLEGQRYANGSIRKSPLRKRTLMPHKFLNPRSLMSINMISSRIVSWVLVNARPSWHSFSKQFYGSVSKTDYVALQLGFIMTHCRGSPKFNFHKYMIRALEDDFKKVVGIRQVILKPPRGIFVYPQIRATIFLQMVYLFLLFAVGIVDICGHFLATECQWVAYLLLAVGTKLEHIISQLAHEVAEKHIAIEGELVVKPSDDHFWFHRARIVLFLIHFILFQNAFEIAFFFWILVQYGFDSCIMGQVRFIVPRLIIGVFIQVLCGYSTLPLYAIVTQMGTHFKKSIFNEHIQVSLVDWAQKVKRKKGLKAAATGSVQGSSTDGSTVGIQLGRVVHKESAPES
ncbi:hypothetical protein RJ639_041272 [Escallonia herrerae]|uniref:MLO-like protein n=1 Tax=Escallonia herrerae TaxID=1293975 RepID=A0AA88WFI6_9ASTE|nr:hypothetical protein RJ639_041272 [Escallonia herrerae]